MTPEVLVGTLAEQVMELNLQQGISNSLDAKLDAAVQALADLVEGNDLAAINNLDAFINAVEAQAGKEIPEEEASRLIELTSAIIYLLMERSL